MGMYTTVVAEVRLKPEAVPIIARLRLAEGGWRGLDGDYPWLKDWAEYSRADFIPFGGSENSLEGDIWKFECELKNYDGTIEYFFENVLPKLAEEVLLLVTQGEEADYPTEWEMQDGKISPTTWGTAGCGHA